YFAGGFYYVAKQQRLDHLKQGKADFNAAPPKIAVVKPAAPADEAASADGTAAPADTAKPEDVAAKPAEVPLKRVPEAAKPTHVAGKRKTAKKKLADAKVPRPPEAVPGSANGAKPR